MLYNCYIIVPSALAIMAEVRLPAYRHRRISRCKVISSSPSTVSTIFSSVATMRSMLASVNFRGRPDLRGAFFCARRRLMDDNERSSSREMSLRVLPCSKWRRRTRACSLAVMRGVLEASMSTRSATMWAKLQAVGIKRMWTQLMDVENLTCMSPSDR